MPTTVTVTGAQMHSKASSPLELEEHLYDSEYLLTISSTSGGNKKKAVPSHSTVTVRRVRSQNCQTHVMGSSSFKFNFKRL